MGGRPAPGDSFGTDPSLKEEIRGREECQSMPDLLFWQGRSRWPLHA
ncbi:Conserved hypothetical protein [Prochlorococcus marinus str. MIT 9313]|uniref:Uncharacterized protein n=1 Tax=Prochlorococcus marinus (strain MIT 9313) TaxID=74547 RepID=B9ERI3_PROMM|nr:Conserved hypothetical protein [Prochlorococcus marinus str. MIT 9313]